jgi:hypothetical protein
MTESEDGITLELLVNTVLRLREMPDNQSKDQTALIREAYLLLQNCRYQLDLLQEESRKLLDLLWGRHEAMQKERMPYTDVLKEILGANDSTHYRKRFKQYIKEGTNDLMAITIGQGAAPIPFEWIPFLREGFWEWNECEVRKAKVQNAKRPRARKNSLDLRKAIPLTDSK